jgi:hypothetical protein
VSMDVTLCEPVHCAFRLQSLLGARDASAPKRLFAT